MPEYIYRISIKVSGSLALWTIPESRSDRISYTVPTYSGLLGMVKNIFWKPEIGIDVLAVKILKNPRRQIVGLDHIKSDGGIRLSTQSYVINPEYLVEIGLYQVNPDSNVKAVIGKYANMLERAIKAGGRRHVYLGCSECHATVESCNTQWNEIKSEMCGTFHVGHIFHHHDNMTGKKYFIKNCEVVDGVIDFSSQLLGEV